MAGEWAALRGEQVYAIRFDGRGGRRRLLAGTEHGHWGAVVRWSDDLGRTWVEPERANLRFPEGDASLARVWQLQPATEDRPDTVWAGVEPAALFRSDDGGETFELVEGLWEHPHRRGGSRGGGLCLHTVLPDPADPERMWIAISTGGVYRSDDGGRSWQARSDGIRAVFLPDKYPEFSQCVHKVAPAGGRPDRLYLQNHWGLYRSDDGATTGRTWPTGCRATSASRWSPTRRPHAAWMIPLDSDQFRCTPDGQARVYRTRDAGNS